MNKPHATIPDYWLGKRYYSLDAYFKATYHEKLYKIAIDAGLTCPNRDGTLDTRGCIFCSAGGSGDFAVSRTNFPSIAMQIEAGKKLFTAKAVGSKYVAYFQAYTNTYGAPEKLKELYLEALSHPDIYGISIATRPDCLGEEILKVLAEVRKAYPDKFLWMELGLQTIHDKTAHFIRRGYELSVFESALTQLVKLQIPVIVHVILGLPGETKEDFLETIQYLNTKEIQGIKLQLLHVLKDTDLVSYCMDLPKANLTNRTKLSCLPENICENSQKPLTDSPNMFYTLTKEDYIDWLMAGLARLSPDIVVHRLTGDGPKDLLLAPLWSLDKRGVLNTITHELKVQDIWQGKDYHGKTFHSPL